MNILIISAVFPPEPVVTAQLSYDIATELSAVHNVTVISPFPTRPENFEFKKNSTVNQFEHIVADSFTSPKSRVLARMWESHSFGKFCKKYIRENYKNIDRIYINSWPLLSQYYIIKTAKRFNVPVITHIQDIYPESLINKLPLGKRIVYNLLLPIDKYILKNSKGVICISENMLNTLSSGRSIPREKFIIVANWQNEQKFAEYQKNKKSHSNDGLFTFMYLGNNGPVAGVELLIEAFAEAKIPRSRLVIAGSGSRTRACQELAQRYPDSKIDFISVPEGAVAEIQDMATVMLLPVKKGAAMSSIPSKLPAYMFSKKPIIGSVDLESDTSRALQQSGCGIVTKPEDKHQLKEAMIEISKWSKEQLLKSGKSGYNYAMENLSRKTNLKKVIDFIIS